MEINQLRIFIKVVQTSSFTKAADLMNTQKAYVSRVITQLETSLGVRLLERTTRSLSLTEVGRELYSRAISIVAAIDDTQKTIQKTLDEPYGVLKLTCGVEFGQLVVNEWICEYLKLYPKVSVEADWTNQVVDLVHEGTDLAIRMGDLPDSTLISRKIGEVKYGLYASPVYLQQNKALQHVQDLNNHELIFFSGSSMKNGWVLQREDDNFRVKSTKVRYRINNSFAVCTAAIAGLGIAKLPCLLADKYVKRGDLSQILSDWMSPSVAVHAVFPSARFLTPKVRTFVELAYKIFQNQSQNIHLSANNFE